MDKIKKLKQMSLDMNVAYLREATLSLLLDIINEHNIQTVLEIGTGVGYSAYMMKQFKPSLDIDTIEFSKTRYECAKTNLAELKNVVVHHLDCFMYETIKQYDLILIDGPKRNQDQLLEHLLKFAHDNTVIFIDNIDLMKLRNIAVPSNNQKHILASLDAFKKYLLNHNEYEFKYHSIDDGIMIGKKKWN